MTCTTPDLLSLACYLGLKSSDIMEALCTSLRLSSTIIYGVVLQMLKECVRVGGTREKLLEIAQAFCFNDAADRIATGTNDFFTP